MGEDVLHASPEDGVVGEGLLDNVADRLVAVVLFVEADTMPASKKGSFLYIYLYRLDKIEIILESQDQILKTKLVKKV